MRPLGSIRNRLTLWIFGLTTVALVVVGLVIDYQVRTMLLAEFDRGLLVRAQGLSALTDFEENEVDFDYTEQLMPAYAAGGNETEYFTLNRMDGDSIAQSETLEDALEDGESINLLPPPGVVYTEPAFREVALVEGESGRLVHFSFNPPLDEDDDEAARDDEKVVSSDVQLQIVVARSTERLEDQIDSARAKLIVIFLGLMAAQTLLTRFALARGLAPLDRLAADVGSLDEDHLHLRLSDPDSVRELAPVFSQLNSTLDRLEDAFHRERSFTGNVAHELRTPIAEMRSFAEVGARWPDDERMATRFFGELVTLSDDMERTVANLLMLARLESGQAETEFESLNLASAIDRCWKRLAARAQDRGIRFENQVGAEVEVQSDADKLSLILTNLMSNAIAHGDENSTVAMRVATDGARFELLVSNVASDLEEADLPRMFDRFWRKDAARTRGRHVGLGLSIVAALTGVLGLTVNSRLTPAREFEIIVGGFEPA